MGDISGIPWRGQPLPEGTYGIYVAKGGGYFAGELDAEIVRYENLDVVFAQVQGVVTFSGNVGKWTVERVATNRWDRNILRGENVLSEDLTIIYVWHNWLHTLVGECLVNISVGPDPGLWLAIGSAPYTELRAWDILGHRLFFGHLELNDRYVAFAFRKVSGNETDLWIDFRRHAIAGVMPQQDEQQDAFGRLETVRYNTPSPGEMK